MHVSCLSDWKSRRVLSRRSGDWATRWMPPQLNRFLDWRKLVQPELFRFDAGSGDGAPRRRRGFDAKGGRWHQAEEVKASFESKGRHDRQKRAVVSQSDPCAARSDKNVRDRKPASKVRANEVA